MVSEPFRSLEHLKNKGHWVNWPIQTVKRGHFGNGQELGILYDEEETRVYMILLGHINSTETLRDQFDRVDQFVYDNVDEMVADGWLVD